MRAPSLSVLGRGPTATAGVVWSAVSVGAIVGMVMSPGLVHVLRPFPSFLPSGWFHFSIRITFFESFICLKAPGITGMTVCHHPLGNEAGSRRVNTNQTDGRGDVGDIGTRGEAADPGARPRVCLLAPHPRLIGPPGSHMIRCRCEELRLLSSSPRLTVSNSLQSDTPRNSLATDQLITPPPYFLPEISQRLVTGRPDSPLSYLLGGHWNW